jgi:hypothetical protein
MADRSEREDPRREFLLKALAAGVFSTMAVVPKAAAQIFGRRPAPLPQGRSIYEIIGPVQVNGQPATAATRVAASDRVETGKGAQVIFVVGADAFILRENSRVEIGGTGAVVNLARLATGALLSVFGRGTPKRVITPTSTIGIRGTGLYVEARADLSYVCNCYGEIEIAVAEDANVTERIVSKHHDAPRYVLKPGAARRIQPAPFVNHTDLELTLIESLVGRTPPFALFDEGYGGARRY